MNFSFEFLDIHIIHLTQLPMLYMTLKWHNINICNKIVFFFNHPTCFLDHLTMIAPQKHMFLKVLNGRALFLWTLWVLLSRLPNLKMTLTILNTSLHIDLGRFVSD